MASPINFSGVTDAQASASNVSSLAQSTQSETATEDFNDFLKLLVAQMQNQDPLKPVEGTEFVAQLATFSAVEQQLSTNSKLDTIIAQGRADQISALSGWVGNGVRADAASFDLAAGPISVDVPEMTDAVSGEAVIRSEDGTEVARFNVPATQDEFTWEGEVPDGLAETRGRFSVSFVFEDSRGFQQQTEAGTGGTVVEARLVGDNAELVLDTGAIIDASDVTALTANTASLTAVSDASDSSETAEPSLLEEAAKTVSDLFE